MRYCLEVIFSAGTLFRINLCVCQCFGVSNECHLQCENVTVSIKWRWRAVVVKRSRLGRPYHTCTELKLYTHKTHRPTNQSTMTLSIFLPPNLSFYSLSLKLLHTFFFLSLSKWKKKQSLKYICIHRTPVMDIDWNGRMRCCTAYSIWCARYQFNYKLCKCQLCVAIKSVKPIIIGQFPYIVYS